MLDYDVLMAPFGDAQPCGPELRDDPEFRDIEDAPGDFANQKPADLMQVIARCDSFLQRTKDQAPALVAMQAAVRIGDFALANAALALVKGYAEVFWEDFHPGPAEEMAIARINELTALARPAAVTLPLQRASLATMPAPSSQGFTAAMIAQACQPTAEWSSADEAALAAQVESGQTSATQARAVRPAREGARTLRMFMRVLSAEARAADAQADVGADDNGMPPDMARGIALALRAQVDEVRTALQTMSDMLYEINAIYDAKVGDSASLGPVLSLVRTIVEDTGRFLTTFPLEEPGEAADVAVEDVVGEDGATAGKVADKGFVVTTPQTRADVLAAMEAIARFYVEREPTSPVPLMLKRVRSWVEMDFLQLLTEIAPQGLGDAQKLLASPNE